MRDPHSRSIGGAQYPPLLMCACCAALVLLLSSCSADLAVQRDAQQAEQALPGTPYSLVCIIHGDGDYLYHDTDGNATRADEVALAAAKRVAQRNPEAEVFLFHQKPRRHFLFFFPLRDGEFSYYRNGRLIAEGSYWRDEGGSPLDPELTLFRRFRADTLRERVTVFMYFGHEIPEFDGAGYHASSPDRAFTVQDLAEGLKGFTPHPGRFDLMILSTCFGGTPYTIGTLGPFAQTIIASPDNLHLSYFDLHSLERLDLRVRKGDVPAFAKTFAHQAFDRLTKDVQTAVSVAVYDVDRVQAFLRSVETKYDRTLTELKGMAQTTAGVGHCDCADLPSYVRPAMSEGIELFYRPARFGRSKYKQEHSGWGCWRETAQQPHTTQTKEPALE
ncbi:MAG: hypothetical protein WEB62_11355 [Bacteroidota bacterium]